MLTAAEHEKASHDMFLKMDADHDSQLTAAELSAGHQKLLNKK